MSALNSKAAVLYEVNQPLKVENITVAPPEAGEVRVKLGASGICHTDLTIASGQFPAPDFPIVLGHEGAGVVESIGAGVTGFSPGDHVVMTVTPSCGECHWCKRGQQTLCGPGMQVTTTSAMADGTNRFSLDHGKSVKQLGGLGTFSEYVVVQQQSLIKIDADVPFDVAALFGCAVLTGVGAAHNAVDIRPGDVVAVIGIGGVGLNVIQGAMACGAARVIAIDLDQTKLDTAVKFGATDFVINDSTLNDRILDLTDGVGVDICFEVVGSEVTAAQALSITRRGGQTCIVGMASLDAELNVSLAVEMQVNQKKILGCNTGAGNPKKDIPDFIDWMKSGRLKIAELISSRYPLEDINQAMESLSAGSETRAVVVYDDYE